MEKRHSGAVEQRQSSIRTKIERGCGTEEQEYESGAVEQRNIRVVQQRYRWETEQIVGQRSKETVGQ